jgi:hypothetical protein
MSCSRDKATLISHKTIISGTDPETFISRTWDARRCEHGITATAEFSHTRPIIGWENANGDVAGPIKNHSSEETLFAPRPELPSRNSSQHRPRLLLLVSTSRLNFPLAAEADYNFYQSAESPQGAATPSEMN